MDFLSTLKQLWLMLFEMFYCRRIYRVLSSIFHRTCGSISNVLDYKNVTWATPNLVYSYVWLLLYFLAFVPPHDVANSFDELYVVIRNQYDEDADEELDYFEDIYIGRFRRNVPDALLYFLSSHGTCSIEPPKSFHEQIIISRLGIIVSKQMFHLLIQRSGSF